MIEIFFVVVLLVLGVSLLKKDREIVEVQDVPATSSGCIWSVALVLFVFLLCLVAVAVGGAALFAVQ